jgi:hypothetical protein
MGTGAFGQSGNFIRRIISSSGSEKS